MFKVVFLALTFSLYIITLSSKGLPVEPPASQAIRLLTSALIDKESNGYYGTSRGTYRDQYIGYVDGKVKVYRPELFKVLREATDVSESTFAECLNARNVVSLFADSKSGQAFWRSSDGTVVLKTIKHYECSNLRSMLDNYAIHVLEDFSCIAGVLGLFRVSLRNGRKVYLLACKNVYHDIGNSNCYRSNVKYDLKGSTVGRAKSEASEVLKDLDLIRSGELLHLGVASKSALIHALHRDVVFLSTHNFMDYSLLVEVEEYSPSLWERISNRVKRFKLPRSVEDRGKLVLLGSDGLIYHFGIIDFLQKYSFRKVLETLLKGLFYDIRKISCVAPKYYARRMFTFVDQWSD